MIIIVKSEFNKEIVDGLLKGCKRAFELPAASKNVSIQSNLPEAVITLGCVIKGDTDHYDYICQAVTNGIMDISVQSSVPVLFGVLTCQNAELAFERSRNNDSNKGYEVGLAALELINSRK